MSNIPNDQLPTPIRPGGATPPPSAPPPTGPPPPPGAPGQYGQPGQYAPPGQYGQPATPGWSVPGQAPGGPARGGNQRRTWLIAGAVAVVLAAGVGIGLAATSGGDDTAGRTEDTDDRDRDDPDDTDAPDEPGGTTSDQLGRVYTILWGATASSAALDCLATEAAGLDAAIDRSAAGEFQSATELQQVLVPYLFCTPTTDSLPVLTASVSNTIGSVDEACATSIWTSLDVNAIAAALATSMSDAAAYTQWVSATFGGCVV